MSAATGASAPDLLAAIVAATRRIVACRRARQADEELAARARALPSRAGRFEAAVARPGRVNVIAECKRRSPSRGLLRPRYDPAAIARSYERAGAAAISVLTEPTFFDGDPAHLRAVRRAVALPVLRKDFIIDEYQLFEAKAWGADAALLIVAALDDRLLAALIRRAASLGLDALVEVHDQAQLDRAVAAGARLIGVNNRDLRTLTVDIGTATRLAARIPAGVIAVAESGVRQPSDLKTLSDAGYRACLVGERLMTSADPGLALEALLRGCDPRVALPGPGTERRA